MGKTHPHLDSPTVEKLEELVAEHAQPVREAYLALHELVIESVPEARFTVDTVDKSIGYGARQLGYNGWGMAAVTPYTKWATLTLLAGAQLPDPAGVLTGTSTMRHVKIASAAEVAERREAIAALLRAAATVHTPTAP